MNAKYQLILQLPASSIESYDEMIRLEEAVENGLGDLGLVDGHDAGSGEMNIFILTNKPGLAFERIRSLVGEKWQSITDIKVAYHEIGEDEFTILHPPELTDFDIQ